MTSLLISSFIETTQTGMMLVLKADQMSFGPLLFVLALE